MSQRARSKGRWIAPSNEQFWAQRLGSSLCSNNPNGGTLGRRRQLGKGLDQTTKDSSAVAELLGGNTHSFEHGEPEIVDRRFAQDAQVATGLQGAAAAAGEQDG